MASAHGSLVEMDAGSAGNCGVTAFRGILFATPDDREDTPPGQPEFFPDLNLDQVLAALTAGRAEYNLSPFFYTPLHSVAAINYRHEVLRDLEDPAIHDCVSAFGRMMHAMRVRMVQAEKLRYRYQRESWFRDAAEVYVNGVHTLTEELARLDLHSPGLRAFRDYLARYAASEVFTAVATDAAQVKEQLAAVSYCLLILGDRITVSRYEGEQDYSAEVADTFAKFKVGAVKDYRVTYHDQVDMNHVEAAVLDLVAGLYPDTFVALDTFSTRHRDYLDATVSTFDREVQFYLAYREFTDRLEQTGLTFCYPQVSTTSKEVWGRAVFDVALAAKLVGEDAPVVSNDFTLTDPERIFVVSGPNQGGKTTFARTFGQLHYLARLGLPVAGSQAQLFLCYTLFTHFEREEDLHDLHGKLQDDLLRIHQILERATPRSVVIMNEIFTSTTLQDAIFLGTRVLERIIEQDLLCVCVTFVDELSELGPATVSMVSAVAAEDPSVRTYKLERRPADGLSHAVAIAEKYRLTYTTLRGRLGS